MQDCVKCGGVTTPGTAYVSLIIAATQLLGGRAWAMGSVIVTATALFLLTVMRTTRGGWRWRWGGKE